MRTILPCHHATFLCGTSLSLRVPPRAQQAHSDSPPSRARAEDFSKFKCSAKCFEAFFPFYDACRLSNEYKDLNKKHNLNGFHARQPPPLPPPPPPLPPAPAPPAGSLAWRGVPDDRLRTQSVCTKGNNAHK